jgi:hypothetical protein
MFSFSGDANGIRTRNCAPKRGECGMSARPCALLEGSLFQGVALAVSCVDSDFRYNPTQTRRDGRVAEGGGLLNRCRVKSSTGGSNPPLSASIFPIFLNLNTNIR